MSPTWQCRAGDFGGGGAAVPMLSGAGLYFCGTKVNVRILGASLTASLASHLLLRAARAQVRSLEDSLQIVRDACLGSPLATSSRTWFLGNSPRTLLRNSSPWIGTSIKTSPGTSLGTFLGTALKTTFGLTLGLTSKQPWDFHCKFPWNCHQNYPGSALGTSLSALIIGSRDNGPPS